VADVCKPSTWETEVRGPGVTGQQPGLHNEFETMKQDPVSKNKTNKIPDTPRKL
jgi:uncharacterized protein affecting Mg2+/Co2+ transport